MSSTGAYLPDWVSPPGETIADLLEEKKLSVEDFARLLEMSKEEAILLLDGDLLLTEGIASRLATVLGSTTSFWKKREQNYREGLKRWAKVSKSQTKK